MQPRTLNRPNSGRSGVSSGENRFDANDMQGWLLWLASPQNCLARDGEVESPRTPVRHERKGRIGIYAQTGERTKALYTNQECRLVSVGIYYAGQSILYNSRPGFTPTWSPPNYATTNTLSTGAILCFMRTSSCHATPLFSSRWIPVSFGLRTLHGSLFIIK
jgi:hypothetical protein